MKLWIVRHAIAMDRNDYRLQYGPQAADELRPLTDDGSKKMRRQAKGLKHLLPHPNALISSPLTRALQTSEILQALWTGSRPQFCEGLSPDSPPQRFVKWAQMHLKLSDTENADVVIVGHNPQLPALIRYFLTAPSTALSLAANIRSKGERKAAKVAQQAKLNQGFETGYEAGADDWEIDLKKGGLCCLEFSGELKQGGGRLVGLLTPKILRHLAEI